MGLLLFILLGLMVGLLARALMPGDPKMPLPVAIGFGIMGAITGGLLSSMATHHQATELHTAGMNGGMLGATVVLFIVGALFQRRALV